MKAAAFDGSLGGDVGCKMIGGFLSAAILSLNTILGLWQYFQLLMA
jgi:hypothetical protein